MHQRRVLVAILIVATGAATAGQDRDAGRGVRSAAREAGPGLHRAQREGGPLDAIRREARERSSAPLYAFQLTDVYGPRLTGSREFRRAAAWVEQTLRDIGLDAVEQLSAVSSEWTEPGWSYRRYAVRIVEPGFTTLAAIPSPWSPSIEGRLVGEPVLFQTPGRAGVPVDEIIARHKGKLKGKILMLADQIRPMTDAWRPVAEADLAFRRSADADLALLRQPARPPSKPATPPAAASQPPRAQRTRDEEDADTRRFYAFLRDEGVLAWLNPTIGNHGTIVAFGPFGRPGFTPPPPPGFNLSVESYNRILRLMQHGVPVKLEVELESEFLDEQGHTSVLGEIRGADLPNEIVLIGAHLDSWHVGAGATDNGANCAVLIDAMRILKVLEVPLARTVRVALWAGEERGLRGSAAYIKRMSERPAEKLRLYLNADSGAGRYRGLQVQERGDFAPVAEDWLAPFRAEGQGVVSVRRSSGSDQVSFERAGLPTAVFLQDPLYGPRTYHTNMDVYDYVVEEDLRQSAAVAAWVLYRAANR
jgi:carboxypeptidase Q